MNKWTSQVWNGTKVLKQLMQGNLFERFILFTEIETGCKSELKFFSFKCAKKTSQLNLGLKFLSLSTSENGEKKITSSTFWASSKRTNNISALIKSDFRNRLKRILFSRWPGYTTHKSSDLKIFVNVRILRLCYSLPLKFCKVTIFQGGSIKSGIFESVLLWNISF